MNFQVSIALLPVYFEKKSLCRSGKMYIKEVQYCSLAPIIGFSNVVQVKMIKLWSGDGGIGSLIVYGIIVVYQLHFYGNCVLR